MAVSKNDITGDSIRTKVVTDKFRDGYDAIFGKKHEDQPVVSTVDIPDSDSTKTKNND